MHLVLQVLATAWELDKAGQRLFKPHGLTVAQFNVLNLLADQPDGWRASDLAASLVVDPSNITGLLKRLSKAGYLTEVANLEDGRQRVVTLSAKGRRLWQRTEAGYRRALDALTHAISPRERETVQTVLTRLAEQAARIA